MNSPVRSPRSQSPEPTAPIRTEKEIQDCVRRLHEYGKIYETHKEELRTQDIKKQLTDCTNIPSVRTESHQHRGGRPVYERLYHSDKDRQMRLEKRKRELEKDSLNESTFKPSLSTRAQSLGKRDIISANAAWLKAKNIRLHQARERQKTEQEASLKGTPELNERSQRLMFHKQATAAVEPDEPHEFYERQIAHASAAAAHLRERMRETNEMQAPGKPWITPYAANMHRDGKVTDRLYNNAVDRLVANAAVKEAENISMEREQLDPSKHKPSITERAQNIQRDASVHDLLHQQAQRQREKKQAKIKLKQQSEEHSLYKPCINPVSDEIANRMQESAVERLTKPKSTARCEEHQKHHSHVPNTTQQQQQQQKSGTPRGERPVFNPSTLAVKEKQRQSKIAALKREQEQRVIQECTFQPNVNRRREPRSGSPATTAHPTTTTTTTPSKPSKSSDTASKAGSTGSPQRQTPEALYYRNMQWANRREQKLEEERQQTQDKELLVCTFAPMLDHKKQGGGTTQSDINETTTGSVDATTTAALTTTDNVPPVCVGFDEFVQRQQQARDRRKESKPIFATGKNWKNSVTTPQPFHLGQHPVQSIKSLHPPVPAPHTPSSASSSSNPTHAASHPHSRTYHTPQTMSDHYTGQTPMTMHRSPSKSTHTASDGAYHLSTPIPSHSTSPTRDYATTSPTRHHQLHLHMQPRVELGGPQGVHGYGSPHHPNTQKGALFDKMGVSLPRGLFSEHSSISIIDKVASSTSVVGSTSSVSSVSQMHFHVEDDVIIEEVTENAC